MAATVVVPSTSMTVWGSVPVRASARPCWRWLSDTRRGPDPTARPARERLAPAARRGVLNRRVGDRVERTARDVRDRQVDDSRRQCRLGDASTLDR